MQKASPKPYSGEARGILNPQMAEKLFRMTRYQPADDLAFFVLRYWIVRWDLRDVPPQVQDTLDYPCINLVFERGHTAVFGAETGRSSKRLEGKSQAFGVKFRPGGFYPFVKTPLSRFTNRAVSLMDALGVDHRPLEDKLADSDDDVAMVKQVEEFLREFQPQPDETISDTIALINQIVDCIVDDRTITRVDDLVRQIGINKRTLQRLFNQYVGVSPKWTIQRYRLHEAAETLAASTGDTVDWSKLALELGYFDQSHFIKDFKAIIGKTPAEYVKGLGL